MFPPFPQDLAKEKLNSLISRLENGEAQLQQVGRESVERKGQGVMIGALVCRNMNTGTPEGTVDVLDGGLTTLYAVSGNCKTLLLGNYADASGRPFGNQPTEIVVPSLVEQTDIDSALAQYDGRIHELTAKINGLEKGAERDALVSARTELTDISLQRVFDLYSFTRFDKKKITLNEIIAKHGGRLPPTGTGDCCAPKLLCYAFEQDLQPISMDEIYYGRDTKTKVNGQSYNPCDDRCGYILPDILGVEILYRDNDIVVVNKEGGLLSVPGRGPEKQDCVEARVRRLFPDCIKQPAVHRLDMETSGILILALNKDAHRELNKAFADGIIEKKYMALLKGTLKGLPEGRIELKARLDINNRPHQILDPENGKLAVTQWKKRGIKTININPYGVEADSQRVTIVEFTPLTGRTHQLRLAAAYGLGVPIVNDTLYGENLMGGRMMLHAYYIKFPHPITKEIIEIETPIPF